MAQERYLPDPRDFNACLAHLVEECGEVLAAAGKTQRFGKWGANPEIEARLGPGEAAEINIDWLSREIDDLSHAIFSMRQAIGRQNAGLEGLPDGAGPCPPLSQRLLMSVVRS